MIERKFRRPARSTIAIMNTIDGLRYGSYVGEIAALTGLDVWKASRRLQAATRRGWLEREVETATVQELGRPRRTYFRLTPEGRKALEKAGDAE